MKMDTRVFPDIDALSRAALEELLRMMQDSSSNGAVLPSHYRVATRRQRCIALWAQSKQQTANSLGSRASFLGRRAVRSA